MRELKVFIEIKGQEILVGHIVGEDYKDAIFQYDDGYSFHKKGTAQHERDKLKDHIMEVAGIRLIRLSTIGSDEKDRIKVALST